MYIKSIISALYITICTNIIHIYNPHGDKQTAPDTTSKIKNDELMRKWWTELTFNKLMTAGFPRKVLEKLETGNRKGK